MRSWLRNRPLLAYLFAVLVSAVALGVVLGLETVVGYIPLLFLAFIALVEVYSGPGPALVSVAICILGSFLFMNARVIVNEHLHNYAKLGIFPFVALAIIYLMETRRRERQAAREQLLELSTLLDSMPEAVFIFDGNARVVDVNRSAEQISACTRDELRGAHMNFLARHLGVHKHEQPAGGSSLAVSRALRGETVQNEARALSNPADGAALDVLVSANPMRNSDGQIIGALLVVRDITEINQLQRQVSDTERHLAIGQMASGIAHDFNNVLNTIAQATALLQSRPGPSEEDRFYLGMIDNSVRRGAEIIKRVREYIRGGSGETALLDVRQLLQDSLELTRPMWRGINSLSVITQFQPVSPVRANAADLRRVFTNLIVNAIQAMPEGGQLVLHCAEHGGKVYVRVQDTGSGISSEQQKKIFLPYFTTKPTGTGLGLSTAQKMLLAQGGNITFQSEPGQGSTFTVEVPAASEQRVGNVA